MGLVHKENIRFIPVNNIDCTLYLEAVKPRIFLPVHDMAVLFINFLHGRRTVWKKHFPHIRRMIVSPHFRNHVVYICSGCDRPFKCRGRQVILLCIIKNGFHRQILIVPVPFPVIGLRIQFFIMADSVAVRPAS